MLALQNVSHSNSFAVLVVTHKRLELLKVLVGSLNQALSSVKSQHEVHFFINGDDIESENYLRQFSHFQLKKISEAVSPAEARNLAAAEITTDWLVFLDDDIELPAEFFSNFTELSQRDTSISVWGGPNLTPENSNLEQKKAGWLLQNSLVTGPISRRYKLNQFTELECKGLYFSLCNMFVRTPAFKKIMFNAGLRTAEENELIFKMAQNGFKMKASDLLFVWHSRRQNLSQFSKQIRNYGYGRGQLIHNGATPVFSVVAALLSLILIFCFPGYFAVLFLIISSSVFIEMNFKFGFQFTDFLLPSRVWINYFTGCIQGYAASFKKAKSSSLQSQDSRY
ncbi:MAG: glycosyltransferase family 2 protein [Pseudobdellovibrio sp.]